MAELVDARDLKSPPEDANYLNSLNLFCKSTASEPIENDGKRSLLQNKKGFGIGFNKTTARGKRYVYLRDTGVALVRGFTGTESELDAILAGPEVAAIISAHSARQIATIAGWRMDAAIALHKVTKSRATHKKLPYELSAQRIEAMLSAAGDGCEVTGIKFDYGRKKTETGWLRRPMAPSIDRIDNSKGYESGNLRLVCVCVNIAINEWGLDNFSAVCRAFVDRSAGLPTQ